jgi:hypothetical protein
VRSAKSPTGQTAALFVRVIGKYLPIELNLVLIVGKIRRIVHDVNKILSGENDLDPFIRKRHPEALSHFGTS